MEFNTIYLYNDVTNTIELDFFLNLTYNDYYSTENQIILQKLVSIDVYFIDFTNQHVSVIMKNQKILNHFICWQRMQYSESAPQNLLHQSYQVSEIVSRFFGFGYFWSYLKCLIFLWFGCFDLNYVYAKKQISIY